MARITITPEQFHFVTFDQARRVELATRVADVAGLPEDLEIRIEVQEQTPLGRVRLASVEPVVVTVEGGAFENAKKPRSMSESSVLDVLARVFFRVRDRLDPAFGDPPGEDELTILQLTAWEVTCEGRAERGGLTPAQPRRRYHFRNRHGFTDVADAVFDRLWTATDPAWSDIEAACVETATAKAAV